MLYAEQPSVSGDSPHVSTLARRIHGWSWQAVRLHSRSGIVISSFISSIVPHRHGHWCRLCHSVGPEGASWAAHESRDRLFLHKPFALYPQFIDSPSPSIMYGPCTSGLVPCLTMDVVVYPQQSKRLVNDPVKGIFVPLIVRIMTALNVLQVLTHNRFYHLLLS